MQTNRLLPAMKRTMIDIPAKSDRMLASTSRGVAAVRLKGRVEGHRLRGWHTNRILKILDGLEIDQIDRRESSFTSTLQSIREGNDGGGMV